MEDRFLNRDKRNPVKDIVKDISLFRFSILFVSGCNYIIDIKYYYVEFLYINKF